MFLVRSRSGSATTLIISNHVQLEHRHLATHPHARSHSLRDAVRTAVGPAHKQTSQDEITYTDEDGASVTQDDIAEYFDEVLGDSGTVYVRGSDGHRYLVSVSVTFERVGED